MDTKGISKLDLKRRNRRQILLAIREAGTLARVDIAARLSLTRAAVTIITNQMISQNILEDLNGPIPEAQEGPKKKGRKKTMIRINPSYKYVLGAVINDNDVCVGLSNLAGESLGSAVLELNDKTEQQEVISFIVNTCVELMQKQNITNKQVLGLGIGIVPPRFAQFRAENKNGIVTFTKLCYLLEMELSVPVCAAGAIALYTLANIDYKAAPNTNQLLIYSGAAYHSAAISDKELLGGIAADTAAIDRMILDPAGAEWEGYPRGSVHAEITRAALLKLLKQATGKDLTIDEANVLYEKGDKAVSSVLDRALDRLALLVYNLAVSNHANAVTLQDFCFAPKSLGILQEKLNMLAGNDELTVKLSPITGEKSFLAGCALAMEKQFFDLGGMQPGETMA